MRPTNAEHGPFYQKYIDLTQGAEQVLPLMQQSFPQLQEFFKIIPPEKATYAYADGKWTLKELVQHLIDTERIMTFRALAVARGEKQLLPGFDEEAYAKNSNANAREWASLTDEMLTARIATVLLYNTFTETHLQQVGNANGHPITANALGFIIVGHLLHHQQVVKEKYL